MARTTSKKTHERKEFTYDGKEFKYSGVIWPDLKQSGKNADRTPMSLTLNGVISIKGCKLVQTDKNTFIAFPQYQKKDGSYDSFVWTPKEFDELEAVAAEAEKLVK